ncbi:EamA family transporter [Bacillus sp. AFS017336]|nr:EamA family transporter [Bacillus sp. AFS002410]PEL11949.1 EamA family transporter [Bacillus sp. AFS017336]
MKKQQIYIILFCIMVVWGFNVIATKVLVENFMPVTMTAIRVFTAGVSVFVILFLIKKVRLLTKKEFGYVFPAMLLNVVAHHYFLSIGLSQTSASNGGLILGMGPLLTALLSVFFLGSVMTFVRILGVLFGFAGVAFIVFQSGGGFHGVSHGDFYVFLAILAQASSFVLIKKASKTLDPRLMTGYMLVMGSIILFGISQILEPGGLASMVHHSAGIWAVFFASAVVATAMGHMLYNFALGKVGTTEAAIFLNLNPFFSLIGAVLFLGEKIVLTQVVGFILILIGVLFGSGVYEDLSRKIKRDNQFQA